MTMPRVTFGIIVLNGEPFTRYVLRALYPFAHEIIVVEGATELGRHAATPEGRSTDGTYAVLRRFKAEEDPEDKVQIVAHHGFWPTKDEQSQAYAERATGDYLWQVDIDEFYQPEDMRAVLELLQREPDITQISFFPITFWGGFDYITDGWYLRRPGTNNFQRVFKWGRGYQYVSHEPLIVADDRGRKLREVRHLSGPEMARRGVRMYHYAFVFPDQVLSKSKYYAQQPWVHSKGAVEWAEEGFMRLKRPFHVHNVYRYPSWLERFKGKHPPAIEQLRADLAAGVISVAQRPADDIERLLNSPLYALGRAALKPFAPLYAWAYLLRHRGQPEW